jgi:hypothetical protein
MSSRLLPKNVKKIKYTKPKFYLWFCMGVKLGLVTLREEHRLRVLENRVAEETIWTEEK